MITISGSLLDQNTIISQFPVKSMERKIIGIMAPSNTIYKYSSVNQLKFELDLRVSIIRAARELHNSDLTFRTFRHAICNPDYWKRTFEGGFLSRSDVKASDAIKDIFVNGSKYGTECSTAMVIVYYKAVLNIFPEELFNQMFPRIHLMNWHYIDSDIGDIGYTRRVRDYLPGDRRYFKNPDVNPATPQWQGENVIDLGDGTFYGHGLGIRTAEGMINGLNRRRRSGATTPAYLMSSAGRPDFKHLFDKYYSFSHRQEVYNYIPAYYQI